MLGHSKYYGNIFDQFSVLVAIAITYDMIWQIHWLVTSYNADGIYATCIKILLLFFGKKMANATKKNNQILWCFYAINLVFAVVFCATTLLSLDEIRKLE